MPRKLRITKRKKKHVKKEKPVTGEPAVSPDAPTPREEMDADLEEIKRMRLVNRAIQEFNARVPQAEITSVRIGYFVDRTVVWCDLTYRLPGSDSSQTQGFGFDRRSGPDWKLNWPEKKLSPLTPLPPFRKLGTFSLRSPKVAVTDPGCDEDACDGRLGCLVAPCAVGEWTVEIAEDSTLERHWKMPRALLLAHESFPSPPAESEQWQRLGHAGGDCGLIVACDLAHFHDASRVPAGQEWTFDGAPADPNDLWYWFVCEVTQDKMAAIIPHGVAVNWDGGMDVDVFRTDGQVVAIRLSISGWPNEI